VKLCYSNCRLSEFDDDSEDLEIVTGEFDDDSRDLETATGEFDDDSRDLEIVTGEMMMNLGMDPNDSVDVSPFSSLIESYCV